MELRDKKILIIEDEASILDIMTYKLKKESYIVMGAENGYDGLIAISYFEPDLILLDVKLPDVNGFDLCKEIKTKYQVPVVMLTSRNSLKDIIKGFELGVEDYITKPFDISNVLQRIDLILKKSDNTSFAKNN